MAVKKDDYDPTGLHELNHKFAYQRRQVKDCIEGPTAVKSAGVLYLPMPASFSEVPAQAAPSVLNGDTGRFGGEPVIASELPFYHENPAYMAYLHRARFPGFSANILNSLLGMVEKYPPKIELPDSIAYLENVCTLDGKSLEELFYLSLYGVLTDGKFAIVVDWNEKGDFYFSPYCAEANNNWKYGVYERRKILLRSSFKDSDGDIKEFEFDVNEGCLYVNEYDHDGEFLESRQLSYAGKPITESNVFYMGSIENVAESFVSPMIGITDCALEIYQIHADLRQAEYLTCNPTLFVFGLGPDEKPTVIGSQVVVGIRNPDARAEYPSTDTSALSHLHHRIQSVAKEAAEMGISFVVGGAGVESAEALSIRQSNKGTNLIHCVNMITKAINDALGFICKLKNIAVEEELFQPNVEFMEIVLNAQDIQALASLWMQGAIPHDVILDNLREARYIKADDTNEKIKARINSEAPNINTSGVVEDGE